MVMASATESIEAAVMAALVYDFQTHLLKKNRSRNEYGSLIHINYFCLFLSSQESEKVRNAIIKISNTCVAGI